MRENWTYDCPMLKPVYIAFFKSNKKYLLAYVDKNGEYCGYFTNKEPDEDIFIHSADLGDRGMAIFERDFSKKPDIHDMNSMEKSLKLIDIYACDDI